MIHFLQPSRYFVFLEEHPDTLNDGFFVDSWEENRWNNLPASYHNGAGGISSLPSIHGLADDRLRIQVDGADLMPACPNHMNSPLSYADPARIESVTVFSGVTPVSVGGDSIGGAILVKSAPPEFATGAELPPTSLGNAILLSDSSFNTVSQNDVHDNGHLAVGLAGTSAGNVVRGNRIANNGLEYGLMSGCTLMLWNGASDNWIVENEVMGPNSVGIMLGPGTSTGNHVLQNRVHGFAGPGIIAAASAQGNVIEQNDARDNGLKFAAPRNVDLYDYSNPADNTWLRNLGTGVAGVS